MKPRQNEILAGWDSISVQLPDFVRTTTFRWTASAFAACIVLFAAFVYWETADYMLMETDAAITDEIFAVAADPPDRQLNAIGDRLRQDPRRIKLAGLFGSDGHRIAGNLAGLPHDLKIDGPAQSAAAVRLDQSSSEAMTVRAIAHSLPNGNVLVIARNVDEFRKLAEVVARALMLGLPLALGLGFLIGMFLSVRAQKRVAELNTLVSHIVAGDLRQRLPTQDLDHPFDKLAEIANGMLNEIEAVVQEMAGVGNEIAHDLRTPLTRVRLFLERGRANAKTLEELQAVADRAIGGVDHALTIITTLLRIADIEYGGRLAGFGKVALADIVREVADLYEPIAENKHISLQVASGDLWGGAEASVFELCRSLRERRIDVRAVILNPGELASRILENAWTRRLTNSLRNASESWRPASSASAVLSSSVEFWSRSRIALASASRSRQASTLSTGIGTSGKNAACSAHDS